MSKRDEVFDFIVKFKQQNDGVSPTFDEIAAACNLSSKSIAFYHVSELIKDGRVYAVGRFGKSRNIGVVGGSWRFGIAKQVTV